MIGGVENEHKPVVGILKVKDTSFNVILLQFWKNKNNCSPLQQKKFWRDMKSHLANQA